jgi:hypothetical protein
MVPSEKCTPPVASFTWRKYYFLFLCWLQKKKLTRLHHYPLHLSYMENTTIFFFSYPETKILHHRQPILVVENTTAFSMVSSGKTCSVLHNIFQPGHIIVAPSTTTTVRCYWYTILFFHLPMIIL